MKKFIYLLLIGLTASYTLSAFSYIKLGTHEENGTRYRLKSFHGNYYHLNVLSIRGDQVYITNQEGCLFNIGGSFDCSSNIMTLSNSDAFLFQIEKPKENQVAFKSVKKRKYISAERNGKLNVRAENLSGWEAFDATHDPYSKLQVGHEKVGSGDIESYVNIINTAILADDSLKDSFLFEGLTPKLSLGKNIVDGRDENWHFHKRFGAIYVISTDTASKRFEMFLKSANKVGLQKDHFLVVTGFPRDDLKDDKVEQMKGDPNNTFKHRQGETACYLAHYHLMRYINSQFNKVRRILIQKSNELIERRRLIEASQVNEELQNLIGFYKRLSSSFIFEDSSGMGFLDDQSKIPSTVNTAQYLESFMEDVPKGWDKLSFYTNQFFKLKHATQVSPSSNTLELQYGFTTKAYGLSAAGLEKAINTLKVIDGLEHDIYPIDVLIANVMKTRIKTYAPTNHLVYRLGTPSAIEEANKSNSDNWRPEPVVFRTPNAPILSNLKIVKRDGEDNEVSIMSFYGQYLAVNVFNDNFESHKDPGEWETFEFIPAEGNTFFIRNKGTGKYLSASPENMNDWSERDRNEWSNGCTLVDKPQEFEKFILVDSENGEYQELISVPHGTKVHIGERGAIWMAD